MLPQDVTEEVLAARLADLGGRIHRGVTATAVAETASGVRVDVASTGTATASISARFVVGADGMRSIVREAAGIEFDGGTYDESFVLADVEMDWPLGTDEVSLFFSPAGLVVVAPLPNGTFRIVATLEDAPSARTPPSCRRSSTRAARPRLRRRCGPWCGAPGSACITGWRRPIAGDRCW